MGSGRSDPRCYGSVSREQLEELADAVLGTEDVRLATAAKDGGPHAVRRAIELAALVLEDVEDLRARGPDVGRGELVAMLDSVMASRALLMLSIWACSGCYRSHLFGELAPRPESDGALGTGTHDAGPSVLGDGSVPGVDDGAVGTALIDESLTCANGATRWAATCSDALTFYVSPAGRTGAAGGATDPLSSPESAVERCGRRACHLRLASGPYTVGAGSLSGDCLYVEGGGELGADGGWAPSTGARSNLIGDGFNDSMISSRGALIVSGVTIENVHTAISINGGHLLVVDHASIDADYSGISISWSSHGARICNTTIDAGYSAVNVSWSSSDVVLDHVDATGGYSGLDVSWDSHDVSVRDSTITGGYEAVSVSQGAYGVELKGSVAITTGDYDEGP